eukprot:521200-Heterocapsa_arctica.AAC.1
MVGSIPASIDGRSTARGFLTNGRLPRVGCSTMRGHSQPSPGSALLQSWRNSCSTHGWASPPAPDGA